MTITQEYRHPKRRKGHCAICRKAVPSDVVCCAPCATEYFTHADQLVAEDLMREALRKPGFREAVATLCAQAAISGEIVLRFKRGRFYRAEFPR